MMTGDTVISAIAVKIGQSIVPTPAIYKKQVNQDAKKPCFFIKCLSGKQNKIGLNWYRRSYLMLVEYHPEETTNKYVECNNAGEFLMDVLETIDLKRDILPDTPLRIIGKDLEYKIKDEVLLFWATYNFNVEKELNVTYPLMGTLETNIFIKE